jgi:hypothetical protein
VGRVVDDYCERTGPGLWAEPLNAVSNVAFLIACGVLLWQLTRQRPPASPAAWTLAALIGVVGLCSLSFHTFATRFTGALDTLSIVVFILVALTLIAGRRYGWPWRRAWLVAPAYVVLAVAVNALLVSVGGVDTTLGGYLPALVVLIGLGLADRSRTLIIAGGVFVVSLTLRTLDGPLCSQVPIGTHFLWHLLNAVVLYLVATYVLGLGRRVQTVPPAADVVAS